MKLNYKPASNLEIFGLRVFNILARFYPQTFFVGGMVRDLLLKRKITDVDMATSAKPEEIVRLLKNQGIELDDKNKSFGAIIAKSGGSEKNFCVQPRGEPKIFLIEITAFRKDQKADNRYPRVKFVSDVKIDSNRRDFTINAFYLNPTTGKILDFHHGLTDLKKHQLKFIGNPRVRIHEDPLRVIRALRFALALNLKPEPKTKIALKNLLKEVDKLTGTKKGREIQKLKNPQKQKLLKQILQNPGLFDRHFK